MGSTSGYAGGSYCGTSQPTGGDATGSGADTHGYWPHGGFYGIDADTYCPGTSGVTWTGNTWDNNSSTVTCT